MREDEDQIRQYMPVLRRIIILVAVLTAIPVAMWTITAFVRTYVGPPKTPTFQPMAATVNPTPDQAAAAPAANASTSPAVDTKATATPTIVEARATTTDAGASAPASNPINAGAPPAPPVDTAPALAAPANAGPAANPANTVVSNPATSAAPTPAPDNSTQVAAQQPAATNWPAPPPAPAVDALPPGEPIAGPVPLPRKRPSTFVMAQTGVPLPQPRPEAAGPGVADAPATPLDWLHHIFQPGGAARQPPADDAGGNVETPN